MKRLVQTLALGAALVAVAVGVWRDYGAVLTLQRAAAAYLVAYFLSGAIALAANAALRHARDPEVAPAEPERRGTGRRRRSPPRTAAPPASAAPAAGPARESADASVEVG